MPPRRHRPWREEAAEIAAKHGITVDQLLSRSRSRRVTWPRQELMWRMCATRRISPARVGQLLGGWDRTTVRHAVQRHEARLSGGAA
ncbi:helix-turn-helix domain-containing protein [Phenylobacterium sp. VNQ135]|uniref:helix-turn-helix domain-containing protein n=1 Tax=Phenylobacterium sp. VNQ135 TaxID=3400922 RepID=UPI003C008BB9